MRLPIPFVKKHPNPTAISFGATNTLRIFGEYQVSIINLTQGGSQIAKFGLTRSLHPCQRKKMSCFSSNVGGFGTQETNGYLKSREGVVLKKLWKWMPMLTRTLFEANNKNRTGSQFLSTKATTWKPSGEGFVKINTDATLFNNFKSSGFGVMA